MSLHLWIGASGFLRRYLVHGLQARGDWVRALDLHLRSDGKPVPPDRMLLPPWGIRTVHIS